MKIRDIKPADPKAPPRGVDVWFIVYGDFKQLEDDKFLDRLVGGEGRRRRREGRSAGKG